MLEDTELFGSALVYNRLMVVGYGMINSIAEPEYWTFANDNPKPMSVIMQEYMNVYAEAFLDLLPKDYSKPLKKNSLHIVGKDNSCSMEEITGGKGCE